MWLSMLDSSGTNITRSRGLFDMFLFCPISSMNVKEVGKSLQGLVLVDFLNRELWYKLTLLAA